MSTFKSPRSIPSGCWAAVAAVGLAVGLLACGGDDEKMAPVPSGGDRVPTRGGTDEPDAAVPVPVPQGANVLVDLSGETLCTYEDDDSMAFPASTGATGVSLAQNGGTIALAYHDDIGERAFRLLSLSGAAEPGVREEGSEGSSGVRIVAVDDGFALSFWREGELHVERVDLEGESVEAPAPLDTSPSGRTTSMLAANGSIHLTVQGDDGLTLAQYPHDDPADVSYRDLLVDSDPVQHAALALLRESVWLAWSSGDTLSMHALEDDEPVVLADTVSGAFDIASGEESGAVAYSYRVEDAELVRYRPFGLDGDVMLEPRSVQHPPAVLRDVAIVPFGRGYALSYRSLTSRDFPHNAIRIAFMTATGEIVYEGEVTPTSRAGGPTDLVATDDGHVVLAWSDTDDNHAHLQRLDCPVALRLCNAEMVEE